MTQSKRIEMLRGKIELAEKQLAAMVRENKQLLGELDTLTRGMDEVARLGEMMIAKVMIGMGFTTIEVPDVSLEEMVKYEITVEAGDGLLVLKLREREDGEQVPGGD